MVVGTVESVGTLAVGVATAPVVVPYRQIRRGVSEAERIYGAYQEGGFEAAFAEDRAIRGERFDDSVETLVSLIPGVNTYRQGAQIIRIYEQEGSFAGGRQVGRTTFSLAMDATVVYGAARAARGALPQAGAGAESAINARLLAQQLTRQEASSVFTLGGGLHPEVLARSRPIIPGSQIRSSAVVRELTADGSNIADWAKYSTETFQSPSGAFQVHFYRNVRTEAINYSIDYKAVFNQGVQP
jgi:hypothetical protein